MTRLTFFAAVISLLLATLAVAEIKSITISDDSRPVIFLQTFGFCVLDSHYVHHFNHSYQKLRIHVLIAALLLMKALSLVCAAEVEFYLRTTGTPHGWSIPFYVFHFIGKVLLFVVIWSFLKPNKRMLIMVIAFQVIGVMGSIVGGETGSYIQNWSLWTHIFSFGEVFCWVWIISSSSSMKRERPNNPASNHTKCRLGQDNNPNK
ncbi:unnamed protein product [Brassica oleracea]|uniref:(rape) hypothetical protein n=1 Tax=Brassica napus TaxID=3708 RepID=A0A816I3W4_BRANA|nr:unnamed protein product [Brassica napus]